MLQCNGGESSDEGETLEGLESLGSPCAAGVCCSMLQCVAACCSVLQCDGGESSDEGETLEGLESLESPRAAGVL